MTPLLIVLLHHHSHSQVADVLLRLAKYLRRLLIEPAVILFNHLVGIQLHLFIHVNLRQLLHT